MRYTIEQKISAVAALHADRRINVLDVTLDAIVDGTAKLSGRLLEQQNLQALRQALDEAMPQLQVDTGAVRVLRQTPPVLRGVATNLTDLHKEPSFLAEMLTQMLPGTELEILEQQDRWCFVRQRDGYLGWAHTPYLDELDASQPTHVVQAPVTHLQSKASDDAPAVTALLAATPVRVVERREGWARIDTPASLLPCGWVRDDHLRDLSILPLDPAGAREQMVADARRLTGVYYLWGGGSAWGIDCSGLAQLVHRLAGYIIPRDADMQHDASRPVEPPFQPGDLIFFASAAGGGESGRRKITHVGVSTGGWNMIHSSRVRNGVYEEDVQASANLRDSFVGARTFMKS
jgi:gamma-D-glutamyl-L-lysine dipeptidyl-peptidase